MTSPGLLVVDKPTGTTSHDVVGRVRRILGTRKVGHAGTLDPMATGVLVIGVDRATRLLGHLALTDKAYAATIRLGVSTVTDDADGPVVSAAPPQAVQALEQSDFVQVLAGLTGTVRQRPSAVSAVKVDGRRAYDLVRSGEDVELPERTVTISSIETDEVRRLTGAVDLDIRVECSSGTYIRAIARDLGERLGVGGHLTRLRRTRVGPFTAEEAVTLDEMAEAPQAALIPMPVVARRCFPVWEVDTPTAHVVTNGVRVPWATVPAGAGPVAMVDPGGRFLALAEDDGGRARYLVVFPES